MKKTNTFIFVFAFLFVFFIFSSSFACLGAAESLTVNGDFEEEDIFWTQSIYVKDVSDFSISNKYAHTGSYSFEISSSQANDARITQELELYPYTFYEAKVYVRSENIQNGIGANISFINCVKTSACVTGTTDEWKEISVIFYSSGITNATISLGLGGYSNMSSGTVWFDDFTVTECPDENYEKFIDLANDIVSTDNQGSSSDNNVIYKTGAKDIMWMLIPLAAFFCVYGIMISKASFNELTEDKNRSKKIILFLIIIAFLYRIVLSLFEFGYSYDINTFKSWASWASFDLFGMYMQDFFLDYPPLYLYILSPIGWIISLTRTSVISSVIIRLPAIIADIVTAYILYNFLSRKINRNWATAITFSYLFNPAIWINSAAWGQVDSVYTMFLMVMIIALVDKRYVRATLWYTLGVLLKPHMIIFTPVIGMALLVVLFVDKGYKTIFKCALTFVLTGVTVLLPFAIRMNALAPSKWDWIIELYSGTLGNYSYATMNGFNFWAMLGKNLTPSTSYFGILNYEMWGKLAIVLVCVTVAALYIYASRRKSTVKDALPVLTALLTIVWIFTFAHKMHERYLFPAIALAIVAFAVTKDKRLLISELLFSVNIFFNTFYILQLSLWFSYPHPANDDILVMFFGGFEFVTFLFVLVTVISILISGKTYKMPGCNREITEADIIPDITDNNDSDFEIIEK
ncbi:MAG: hypothetical protein E7315_02985 [Clostridiales bacterium]|nr:hypothetical protein [Clostridiales bacterium]